ncbi:MAG: Uma2 family endonuclease [Clostridiales bacterium]|nr:Uma2 family endonuclease [Clostridiales bacterium]
MEKRIKKNIEMKAENKTEKNIEKNVAFSYSFEEAEPCTVSEALAEYAVSKRQGDYTLEDYLALPDDRRVELIDGVIYDMAAPTYIHQAIGDSLQALFNDYIRRKHGSCRAFTAPVDVQLDCDDKTIVQPDVLIVCDFTKLRKGRVYGAPDLVVEILSPATSRRDRSLKLTKYKRAGVREYWMIDPDYRRVYVHEFEKGEAYEIYDFNDTVPVGIYGGDCVIDFAQIYEEIRILYDTM